MTMLTTAWAGIGLLTSLARRAVRAGSTRVLRRAARPRTARLLSRLDARTLRDIGLSPMQVSAWSRGEELGRLPRPRPE